MAKKKLPSFEIPDTVREAGQSGWVYRTETDGAARVPRPKTAARQRELAKHPATPRVQVARPAASKRAPKAKNRLAAPTRTHAPTKEAVTPIATPVIAPKPPELPAAPAVPSATKGTSPGIASGLIGFGLQVAAVPFVVPLYVTAAISRRLGLD